MNTNNLIVQKLWNLCHALRDDGITYLQYVTELTYLLFLKMMQERDGDAQLPEGCRWADLISREGIDQLDYYRVILLRLGSKNASPRVRAIFANAQTSLKQPRILNKLLQTMNGMDWYSAKEEGLGDLYEGLLERNASEKKSGAGQYFTPRPLIESIVVLMKPQAGELVQDPAAGTGGFLIAADRYIKQCTDDLYDLDTAAQSFQRHQAFYGIELVQDAHRLLLMNLMLHGIEGAVHLGDTLSAAGKGLAKANVILTNPPFGTKRGGGTPTRAFTYPTSNKQLAFLQHVYRGLKLGGRAAVVLPDNVLFEDGQGRQIRADLMHKCNLHTILRLPTGIFYAQGVKTNVLFFQRGTTDIGNTQQVWIYDMRTNMPSFGKRMPLSRNHFQDFEAAYGEKPNGGSLRQELSESGRWRCFSRQDIADRDDNLDITWLKAESLYTADTMPEPEEIAVQILAKLQTATSEIEMLVATLGNGTTVVVEDDLVTDSTLE